MAFIGHLQQGMWQHPRDRSGASDTIASGPSWPGCWNAGCSTGCFRPMISASTTSMTVLPMPLRHPVQVPLLDPLVPAMAAVTSQLGFGVTANLAYEQPFLFARRMATLDQLTGGPLGWNIVTGYLDSAARAMGFSAQMAHDDRYNWTEEFMQLVYQLWQHGWDDDAVRLEPGRFTDPARVHRIRHTGVGLPTGPRRGLAGGCTALLRPAAPPPLAPIFVAVLAVLRPGPPTPVNAVRRSSFPPRSAQLAATAT